MFTIAPVTEAQVKDSLKRNLTLTITDDSDESDYTIPSIVETLVFASNCGFTVVSDSFYGVVTIVDDWHEDYPEYCKQIVEVYADLFSREVADDIANHWHDTIHDS